MILIQRKNGNTAERNPVVSTQDQILQGQCWGWAGWLKQMWIAAEIEGMSEGKIFWKPYVYLSTWIWNGGYQLLRFFCANNWSKCI